MSQQALFIGRRRERAFLFTGLEDLDAMEAVVPNVRKIVFLPVVGHWTQQEVPDEVNVEPIGFLRCESEL